MRSVLMKLVVAASALTPLSISAGAAEIVRVRGTIVKVEGATLSIRTVDGSTAGLRLDPQARITAAMTASLADVKPGMTVGVANTGPNGLQDALEVHIFAETARGADEGQTPWDLGTRSRMTIGTAGARVESYDGQNLTISFKGGESTIQVRPNTPVVRFERGSARDLTVGAPVFVGAASRNADGLLEVGAIVVGKAGARLAM